MNNSHVDEEIKLLVAELQRLGAANASFDGKTTCKFGVLVRDERCEQIFEALVGTLRAAKRRKVVDYQGEMLLQGAHDAVDVVLLKTEVAAT